MAQEVIPDDVKKVIKETFLNELKDDVLIEVFTKTGMNDQFNEAAIGFVKALAALSDKLKVSFHMVGDSQSVKRNVTRSPTVLIAPDKYRIRYTGAPVGEEGRSFLVALMMASSGKTPLTEPAIKKITDELRDKRDIQVFVSPTCPYCPQQVLSAFSAAIVKPDLVSAEAVEIYENQDLAESLGSLAVPQTFMNKTFTGAGLQPEPMFVESLLTLKEPLIASTQISGEPVEKDLVIIGGGPAGLTAAIYAVRAGLEYRGDRKKQPRRPGGDHAGGRELSGVHAHRRKEPRRPYRAAGGAVLRDPCRRIRDRDSKKDQQQDNKIHLKTNHAIYHHEGAGDRHGRGEPRARSRGRPEILRQGSKLLRHVRRVLLQGRQAGGRGGRREYGHHGRALSSQPRRKGDPGPLARHPAGARHGSRKASSSRGSRRCGTARCGRLPGTRS